MVFAQRGPNIHHTMNLTKIITLTPLMIIMLGLGSCGTTFQDTKISSAGGTCEMIVVMNDLHWDGIAGEAVRNLYGAMQPALPQDEPWMDIVHMTSAGFTDLFRKHRNIIITEFDPSLPRTKISVSHDVWSQPQVVIRISSPNDESFVEEFNSKSQALFTLVRESEFARLAKAYRSSPAKLSEEKVMRRFNIHLNIPTGFNVVVDEPDFIWMKRDAGKYDQGIFIYKRPFRNELQLSEANIILLRDSVTERYVPGPFENSGHMAIELLFPPVRNTVSLNGIQSTELRGEWRVTNYHMGGPFVNYTVVDTASGNIIWLDGYVHNPGGEKRDALIHVEGVFHTLLFGGNETPEK